MRNTLRQRIVTAWYCLLGRGVIFNIKIAEVNEGLRISSDRRMAVVNCMFSGVDFELSEVDP